MSAREERDRITDARLENWSRWAKGGIPGLARDSGERRPECLDTLDAEVLEPVLCRLERERPRFYAVVTCRYLRDWPDDVSATFLEISRTQYKERVSKMLVWVDAAAPEGADRVLEWIDRVA